MSRRMKRVNELIKREIGEILLHDLKDPNIGFCTVTNVEVTNDLRIAYARVSILGEEKQKQIAIEHLEKASGYVQKLLRSRVVLRYIPKVIFKLDTAIDHSYKIEELLKQIHANDAPQAEDIADEEEDTAGEDDKI